MGRLSGIGLFLLDMDGTFYLGDALLPGAADFWAECHRRGVKTCFLTNNSSKSGADYLQKLAGLGVTATPQEMYTSGDATAQYLMENGFERDILLVGTESLHSLFRAAGFETRAQNPKAVVLGFDTTIDYEKLTALCGAVRAGLPYIATHPDYNCPVPGGYIPDIGAVIAFVKASCGQEPDVVIGKPNGFIAEGAAKRAGVPLERVCMVGDRLYTDIALGRCGVQTALVLSGETTAAELAASGMTPDFVFENLAAMVGEL